MLFLPRTPTKEEKEIRRIERARERAERREQKRLERQRKKEMKAIRREQKKEVKYMWNRIPHWLANMEIAYWYRKKDKDLFAKDYNPIKFSLALVGEDAYYFLVKTTHLPRTVTIPKLKHPDTIDTLTQAAGSQVKVEERSTGFWYVVESQYGRGAIPKLVGYSEMLKRMEKEAPPLTFPLGMSANQQPHFGDIDKMLSTLVGGTTGGGKSNIVNVMLCTFLPRNHPENLRLFLTDLKGGIEFADYRGIPHLGGDIRYIKKVTIKGEGKQRRKKTTYKTIDRNYIPNGDEEIHDPMGNQILTEPGQVIPILKYIVAELDRRATLMAGKAKKIATYNNKYPGTQLSRWLIVIDELATLMEHPSYNKEAALQLSEIARKGRAVGIYIIVATQTPSSAIVPQQVGNNMDSRIAFRTGSGVASGILLGGGEYDAARLKNIPGRFIFKQGGTKTEMQAPLLDDRAIPGILAPVRRGEFDDAYHAELHQKAIHMFEISLKRCNGECHSHRIYDLMKPYGFKQTEVRSILEKYEVRDGEPEITIGDNVYILAPAIIPRKVARWLVPVSDWNEKRHPHPDFDFDLACRLSLVENQHSQAEIPDDESTIQPDFEPESPDQPLVQAGPINGDGRKIEISDDEMELETWIHNEQD